MSRTRPPLVADRAAGGTRPGSRGPGARRRGVQPRTGPTPAVGEAFATSTLDGAPRWVGGVLCAVQAAVLSLLVLVLPAVAAFVATAADPSNAHVTWLRAVRVGASLWLAGHGVAPVVAGTAVTLVPLGATVLLVFACYASARRSGVPVRAAFLAGTGAYAVLVALVALACGAGVPGALRGLLGGAVVAGLGIGAGLLRRPGAPTLRAATRPYWSRLPGWSRVGAAAGGLAAGMLVLVSSVLAAAWVVAGTATVRDIVEGLGVESVGGVVLAFGELLFVPDLVVWALAWLAGPGFAVGSGTSFAPGGLTTGPMPAIPLLGALPTSSLPGAWQLATPLVLAGVGALAGWYVHRRLVRDDVWWRAVAACAVLALAAGAVCAVLVALASGGVGPGRMEQVGASAWKVGVAVVWPVLLGALAVVVPSDAGVRAGVARRLGRPRDVG
ncbi:DUF6350 family protein [Cellulomonas sp. HZM]|uniref:cell division protein PerM n=1 Tax=Cellulomonas sp. HZM TaxID=1454010 RepID=UPI000A8EAC87|nr:DUF6350 family protein [Cellulomonas sp. HZM]